MGIAQNMKRLILFGNLLLLLVVVNSSDVKFKEKGDLKLKSPLVVENNGTKITNDQKGGTRFGVDPFKVTQLKNENEGVEKDLSNKSNVSESLEYKKDDDDSGNVELKDKDGDDDDKSGNVGGGFDSKSEAKKGSSREEEVLRDDECDPSNMCVDQKKNLTACLRVPGNDSPDLSLLIRNKGSEPVTVTITAPEFVHLEESKVQLQQKEDRKIIVTVAYEAMDSLILLITENSHCSLDFKELIPRDARIGTHYAFQLGYFNNLTRTHCVILLTLFAFVVFGSAWMCSGMCKKLYQGNGYQTIDTEIPLSKVSKTGLESDDGWDDSWDDHWDDEEAPKTPALPVTPNLSLRGLASRRLSKEGWKN